MRFRRINSKQNRKSKLNWIWRGALLTCLAVIFSGAFWTINRYVPPQHLFWKPLETSRPLGFATKQQLFALNFKSSQTCMNLARDAKGYKTILADPKRK